MWQKDRCYVLHGRTSQTANIVIGEEEGRFHVVHHTLLFNEYAHMLQFEAAKLASVSIITLVTLGTSTTCFFCTDVKSSHWIFDLSATDYMAGTLLLLYIILIILAFLLSQ